MRRRETADWLRTIPQDRGTRLTEGVKTIAQTATAERPISPRVERHLRQSIPAYILQGDLLSLVTAPIIYSLLLPFMLLDLWVTLYQWVCFPVYGMRRVPRRRYFAVDRHKLAYLNGIEKVNCTFCSYANGLIAYVREVAGRSEQYWCPIKHARAMSAPHQRYRAFLDYGDAEGYREELPALRRALRRPVQRAVGKRRKRGGHGHRRAAAVG